MMQVARKFTAKQIIKDIKVLITSLDANLEINENDFENDEDYILSTIQSDLIESNLFNPRFFKQVCCSMFYIE